VHGDGGYDGLFTPDALFSIHSLTMNDNSFRGSIPKEIAKLSNLEFLDLSGNNFTGTFTKKEILAGEISNF
jgi:hypothetical protein